MWFKKKSVLQGEGNYNSNIAVNGTDWRTNGNGSSWFVSQTLPDAADANNYFYLPALGIYNSGTLNNIGYGGHYWSSTTDPQYSNYAYHLSFNSASVYMSNYNRNGGFRVGGFE